MMAYFAMVFCLTSFTGCCIFKRPRESVWAPRSIGTEELATSGVLCNSIMIQPILHGLLKINQILVWHVGHPTLGQGCEIFL